MTTLMGAERDGHRLNYEETELRLGLPGGNGDDGETAKNSGKRGFSETVDLKLNLSSRDLKMDQSEKMTENNLVPRSGDPPKPPAKAQVVGWPPVRSFRKNILAVQKNSAGRGMFVDSCKRLRFMKGSEAIGLAPRAVEKCKNRS
ncbi:hypothetical protein F0562_029507 [Nyssa sinensis]|uniref:Auxin-responsive protein n=1 Tax=Nyssa sinensis TaxID=561372 RepID=A0A5J5B2X5_9ASTE|nr:hypothetical protein F0562_029507 [Nyssa sinensis]